MGKTINTILNLKDNFSKTLKDTANNTNKFKLHLKEANKITDKITSSLAKFSKVALGASTAFVGGGLAVAVKSFNDYDNAIRQAASSTGATSDEIKGLKDAIKDVYANNFGDDWNDVAESVAAVKKTMGGTSEEIKLATKNALALRDTFGYEIPETARTADMLIKQFGLDGAEAFNLIAQGSQKGLDKNGNLLDSINEYSVHFKNLGLNAETMFSVFSAGAAKGVFDIDKMGDAFKEFGIRGKDGSDTTNEAFKILGLNAKKNARCFC